MSEVEKVLWIIVGIIHLIGAIIAIIIHKLDGTFKYAAENGDGIRTAKPSDVLFQDLVLWEFFFLAFIMDSVAKWINSLFGGY